MEEKDGKERWVIPFLIVVLVVVAGVISWSLISRRSVPTKDTGTASLPMSDQSTAPTVAEDVSTVPTSIEDEAENVPASTGQEQSTATIGTAVGDTAPAFTLKDLNGNTVSLSQYRGHVVILDFWASWCGPCRASMPTLHRLADEYSDEGLVMIGVSLDRSASAASSFLKQNGYTDMVALWESTTASQGVAREYGISAIPHTFVIDRNGIIRFANHPMLLKASLLDSLF